MFKTMFLVFLALVVLVAGEEETKSEASSDVTKRGIAGYGQGWGWVPQGLGWSGYAGQGWNGWGWKGYNSAYGYNAGGDGWGWGWNGHNEHYGGHAYPSHGHGWH